MTPQSHSWVGGCGGVCVGVYLYIHVYTQEKWKHTATGKLYTDVQSIIIHTSPKVSTIKMSPTDGWMDKQNTVFPYNRVFITRQLERDEVLTRATRMDLENTLLSEGKQSQKITICMIPVIWNIGRSKPIETRSRGVGASVGEGGLWRGENGECMLMGMGLSGVRIFC